MAVQSTVNIRQAAGLAGDLYDDSPNRIDPKIVVKSGTVYPEVGRIFTVKDASSDPTEVCVGGTGSIAGLLVNSKEYVRSNGLTAGLTVADNSVGQIMSFGRAWVKVPDAITITSEPVYNQATGEVTGIVAGGTVSAGYTKIANAKFVEVNAGTASMAVLELNL